MNRNLGKMSTDMQKTIGIKNKLFWAFNGEMEDNEIRRQISDFKAKGFGGFFMHARGGLCVPYMSEQWFHVVEVAVDEAKVQGLEAWLYDEDGWPSGFGGGKVNGLGEEYQQKELSFSSDVSHILMRYRKQERVAPPRAEERYACFADGGYAPCGKHEQSDLICGYKVNPYYVDVFSSAVTDAFIRCTHEKYKERIGKEFGHTVKGIFTDEPQYCVMPYSAALFNFFMEEYGYDPLPWLYLLHEESMAGKVFRTDYYGAVCKLFERNYVLKISDWCRRNNLLFTGHFPEEDGVSTQFLKGGDTMLNYVNMDYPGIDFLGRRLTSPVLLKQIASVKNQLGKSHTLSETFGCAGWNTALWQYKRLWGYQNVLGVDTACLHLAAYTTRGVRKRDYPAFFSYQSSWWTHVSALNEYMQMLNEFAQHGKSVNDVLLLSPVTDAYGEGRHSAKAGEISTQFRLLVESLLDLQIPFDIADENYLASVMHEVKNGAVEVGEMRYRVLIVPYMNNVCAETKHLIEQAEQSGVRVVFATKKPMLCAGVLAHWSNEWQKYPRGAVVQNRSALWGKYFSYIHYQRRAFVTNNGCIKSGLMLRVQAEENKCYVAVYNTNSHTSIDGTLCIAGEGSIYAVNTEAKENVTLSSDNEYTYAKITVAPGETSLFVWEGGEVSISPSYEVQRATWLMPDCAALCDDNAFTLDYAALSIDGAPYEQEQYVVHLQDEVLRLAQDSEVPRHIAVRYTFTVRALPKKIHLCCEFATADEAECNGKALHFGNEFYIDKAILRTDITPLVHIGNNEIVLRYTVQPSKCDFDLGKVFETEKNRFSYDAEIECVYLVGDFDVQAQGTISNSLTFYRVQKCGFVLTAPQEKDFSCELTRQGLWFYRGNVRSEFTYMYEHGRIYLRISEAAGVLTEVRVNGKFAGCLSGEQTLEITRLLCKGKNKLQTVLFGSNRNLLGPHHHYKGEQNFVGVNTFRGVRGYEDEVVTVDAPENTFVSSYAFVPLCTGKLYIIEKDIYKKQVKGR